MTQTFNLSLFKHKRDTTPQVINLGWQQLCEQFRVAEVRQDKDGLLFSPAFFEPAHRLKQNVREVSMLVLDIDHKADLETIKIQLATLESAFLIHSTHSHLRQIETNPNGEPRFRICLPLASPIPVKDFPALWQYVKQKTGLPLDESAKDASRMFYVPAIATKDAPYVFFCGLGSFLDWRKLPPNSSSENGKANDDNPKMSNAVDFKFHDDRHAELCRRIEAQAKSTGRGTFEMKCPAHNGKGNSSLFYAPDTKSVSCRKGCSYFEILPAFGLPNQKLQNRESTIQNPDSKAENEKTSKRLRTVRMSDIETEAVQWLWQDYIPLGAFTILEGEEGLGKTWILCALAGAVAQGYGLPNNPNTEPANVLMMSAEDSLSFVIKPRLEAVKAPCERIIAIDEHFTLDKEGIRRLEFELAEHDPRLVVIDPLFSYTGKINLNNDNEIRSITDELTRLAEKYECAIIGVRHIGKSKGMGDARNAGLNGIGWRASARIGLLVGKDPNNENRRAIVQTKNNLAPKIEKAIGYEIMAGEFFWKESNLTASVMLSIPKDDEKRGEHNDAMAYLREALRDGKRKSGDLISDAKKLGISQQNLRTARHKLGVKSTNIGYGEKKQWFSELPNNDCLDSDANCLDVDRTNYQHLNINNSDKTSYASNLPLDVATSVNQHLSAAKQFLNDTKNTTKMEQNQSVLCPTCIRELGKLPNGQLFCEICLYIKPL